MPDNIAELLRPFQRAVENPVSYARDWKEKHQKAVVGFFCSYAPEEILLAADVLPFRMFGSGKQISLVDAHLQAYSCSLVRGTLEDALSGELDFLSGTVFPHTCDSIMRLSDMWRMNLSFDFHLDVVLPVKLNQQNAREYLVDVLNKFRVDLETAMGVDIGDEQIRVSVNLMNRIRLLLNELYDLKANHPGIISASDLNTVVKASMFMDRHEVCDLLEPLLKAFKAKGDTDTLSPAGKRLLLAGGLCSMPDIFDIIETSGGIVVGDDFCTGARYVTGQIDTDGGLMTAIADRYAERIICPAKHSGLFSRGDHIVRLAQEKKADGVIFLYLKFCDPHAFDYPYMREMLDQAGFPSMVFEIEDQLPSEGQFKTRCEAFIEML